ncbi:MAG: hypothetical protein ACK4FB_00670 [Brevundimonas sp.]|uniref:hypothetical protein n=1 Tax=Brevundimonas sp. TaxID=1871086 RepID=UPI00391AD38A
MKILRFILVMVVIGYAGWLAWPFISPFLEGAGPEAAAARSGAVVALDSGGDMPTAALWIGAVVLYLVSALLLGAGNPRAVVAYFLGFLADIVLRLAMSPDRGVSADIAARSAEAVPAPAGLDPQWIVIAALLLVGLLVMAASRRVRRSRAPGQLTS